MRVINRYLCHEIKFSKCLTMELLPVVLSVRRLAFVKVMPVAIFVFQRPYQLVT